MPVVAVYTPIGICLFILGSDCDPVGAVVQAVQGNRAVIGGLPYNCTILEGISRQTVAGQNGYLIPACMSARKGGSDTAGLVVEHIAIAH